MYVVKGKIAGAFLILCEFVFVVPITRKSYPDSAEVLVSTVPPATSISFLSTGGLGSVLFPIKKVFPAKIFSSSPLTRCWQ